MTFGEPINRRGRPDAQPMVSPRVGGCGVDCCRVGAAMILGMPDLTMEQIRVYSRKTIADLQSAPPMIDVHDREKQAHAIIHHLLGVIDQLQLPSNTEGL